MTTGRQWNAQIFPVERRKSEDRNRTGDSWWVAKDRAAFQEELQRQAPRMSGSKTGKVEGFSDDLRTRGQMP